MSVSMPVHMLQDILRDAELLSEKCYIDGHWVGQPGIPVINPATAKELGRVPALGAREATEAVDAAARAFPGWAKRVCKERGTLLRKWYELILTAKEDLAVILTAEQGKPLAEAKGEIEYAASFVEFYAEETKRIAGEILPSHRGDARLLVMRQPIGVVTAITPWNFPCAMITRKIAPALAAGCTVVVKPAEETPLSALALAVLAERAGIPPGVLNVITGEPAAIGKVFTSHSAVRVVGFTGSTEVGKLLMRQAADGVKRVALELGGNAPFIVFDDANMADAVKGAMDTKFRNMGQTCVCANRFYAQESIYDKFVSELSAAVTKLTVGDGMLPGVTQGPLINSQGLEKVENHVADAREKGAKLVVGGKRHTLGGTFFEPTVVSEVTAEMRIAREETFGPVAAVFRFRTEDEVIRYANDTEFGLAAYLYSRDVGRIFRVAEAMEYGMVGVNSGLISTELAPFGGAKQSGNGREGSHHGIDEFVEKKYVMLAGL